MENKFLHIKYRLLLQEGHESVAKYCFYKLTCHHCCCENSDRNENCQSQDLKLSCFLNETYPLVSKSLNIIYYLTQCAKIGKRSLSPVFSSRGRQIPGNTVSEDFKTRYICKKKAYSDIAL